MFDGLTANRSPEELVFTNGSDRRRRTTAEPSRWRKSEQTKATRKASEKAGMEPVTFHELRHTYASMLVNRGCAMSVVAELLDHSSAAVTEKHYAHLARSTVRDELLRIMPRLGILGEGKGR